MLRQTTPRCVYRLRFARPGPDSAKGAGDFSGHECLRGRRPHFAPCSARPKFMSSRSGCPAHQMPEPRICVAIDAPLVSWSSSRRNAFCPGCLICRAREAEMKARRERGYPGARAGVRAGKQPPHLGKRHQALSAVRCCRSDEPLSRGENRVSRPRYGPKQLRGCAQSFAKSFTKIASHRRALDTGWKRTGR